MLNRHRWFLFPAEFFRVWSQLIQKHSAATKGSEEIARELVIARGDAAEVLEAAEHVLDGVAALIAFAIERSRYLRSSLLGDDGH
jgi:hypothetical protein